MHVPETTPGQTEAYLATIDLEQPVQVVNASGVDTNVPATRGLFGMGRKPQYLLSKALPPKQAAALQATQRWVQSPTDENRRAAYTAAEAATFGTPAGCVALAAFLSGGSLAPPDLQAVPPPEYACGQAAGSAIVIAGIVSSPEKAPQKYARFLAEGFAIASGKPPTDKPL